MCKCNNVEIGIYANQVVLITPPHMKEWRKKSAPGCDYNTICVDACLKSEIKELWSLGITTTGCCCGHNKVPGYIGVIDSDIIHMQVMGYEPVHPDPNRKDIFKAKSV